MRPEERNGTEGATHLGQRTRDSLNEDFRNESGVTASTVEEVSPKLGGSPGLSHSFAVKIPRNLKRLVHAGVCAAINLWKHAAESARR